VRAADRLALSALEDKLAQARRSGNDEPALEVLATALAQLGIGPSAPQALTASSRCCTQPAENDACTDPRATASPSTRPIAETRRADSLRSTRSSDLIGCCNAPRPARNVQPRPDRDDPSPANPPEIQEARANVSSGATELWLTKRKLAATLEVSIRWIEGQQQLGLPHLRMGGMNRYQLSAVESWLRTRYGTEGT
jgi:hypothetical protein